MTKVTMPDPVAWITRTKTIGPNYGKESFGKLPVKSLNRLTYEHEPLITTAQAEAYADARVREAAGKWVAVQGEPVAHIFYALHDATEGQKYIKKDVDDGCLAIFEREEDAQRAKRRHPGTDYKRVDCYSTQQPAPDVSALVEALEHLKERFQKSKYLQEVCNDALAAHRKGGDA